VEEKSVKIMELENGLVLKISDASKKIAGDRWQVSFIARIEIFTDNVLSEKNSSLNVTADEIKEKLGNMVVFEKKEVRNFIDEKNKEEVFENLCLSFLASSLSYLSRADFSGKFILKKYKEHTAKALCYAT